MGTPSGFVPDAATPLAPPGFVPDAAAQSAPVPTPAGFEPDPPGFVPDSAPASGGSLFSDAVNLGAQFRNAYVAPDQKPLPQQMPTAKQRWDAAKEMPLIGAEIRGGTKVYHALTQQEPWEQRILSGVGALMEMGTPAFLPEGGGAVADAISGEAGPLLRLAASLGIGAGASEGSKAAAEKLGLDPLDAQLLGLGVGLGSGAYSAKAMGVLDRLLERQAPTVPAASGADYLVSGVTPSAESSKDASLSVEGATPRRTSWSSPPDTQEPWRQISGQSLPSEPTTARTSSWSQYLGPSQTSPGLSMDSASNRPILQPNGDLAQLSQLAAEAKPGLENLVAQAAEGVPGASLTAVRAAKDPARLAEKIAAGKPAQTLSDYLATRIVVDTGDAADAVAAKLHALGDVMDDDDFMDDGKPEKGGYRARNLQIRMPNGLSAEVQIVPRDVFDVRHQTHALYEIVRAGTDPRAADAARAGAEAMNREAYGRFVARAGVGPDAAVPGPAGAGAGAAVVYNADKYGEFEAKARAAGPVDEGRGAPGARDTGAGPAPGSGVQTPAPGGRGQPEAFGPGGRGLGAPGELAATEVAYRRANGLPGAPEGWDPQEYWEGAFGTEQPSAHPNPAPASPEGRAYWEGRSGIPLDFDEASRAARVRSSLQVPAVRLDPNTAASGASVGYRQFERGAKDFDSWARGMTAELGPGVQPHLAQLWGDVQARAAQGRMAGNINLDRLNTPGEIKKEIVRTAAAMPDALAAQARGQVPLQSTAAAARQMVADGQISEERLSRVVRGTAFNAEEMTAARGIMLHTAQLAKEAADAYGASPTDENLAALNAAVARHGAIQKSVAGLTAEAGRALSSFRILSQALESRSGIETALARTGGKELTAQAARDLAAIPDGDPVAVAKFLRTQHQWTGGEKLQAWWTASLLSSPRTMAAKTVGDMVMAALDPEVRVLRGGMDALASRLSGRPRQYFAGEALPSLAAWFHGLGEGYQKGLFLMRHGMSADAAQNVAEGLEMPRYQLPGAGKNPMNWGPRFLEAATEMMRTAALQAEETAGAYRLGRGKGLTGAALRADMASTLADLPAELANSATEFARRQTFTNNTKFMNGLTNLLDNSVGQLRGKVSQRGGHGQVAGMRPLRFFIPFARVPYNIFARGVELTPAGLAAGFARGDSDLMARGLIGSVVLAAAAKWAADGNVTGAAPSSPRDRAAFYAEGKQPFSLRIGDRWVSYERNFGVLGLPMAAAAAFKARYDHQGVAPTPDLIWRAAGGLAAMFGDLPFVTGVTALSQALNDPQRFGPSVVASLAAGLVPFSAGLRVAAHLQDPRARDARMVYRRIVDGIPWVDRAVPVRYDPMGNAEVNRGDEGVLNAVLPSPVSSAAPEGDAGAETARLGVYPSPASRTVIIGGQHIRLPAAQAQAYQQQVGQAQQQAASALMSDPSYFQANDEERQRVLRLTMARARRYAEARFKGEMATGDQ